jgi:uncharacterized protein
MAEIEYVLCHASTVMIPDSKNSRVEDRFVAIGRSSTGRHAFVIFTPRLVGDEVLLRPISARYMHLKEIKKYEQEISRAQK